MNSCTAEPAHDQIDLSRKVSAIYDEVVHWRKCLFHVPSGAAGKQYIKEMTRCIELWNEESDPMCNNTKHRFGKNIIGGRHLQLADAPYEFITAIYNWRPL